MRVVCRILASIAILIGILMFLAMLTARGNRDNEMAAFVGSILFGAGLLSLTILTASEPHWPNDRHRRSLGNKPYTIDDEDNDQ